MPEVHFIGAIEDVSGGGACDDELCVTWALIPGETSGDRCVSVCRRGEGGIMPSSTQRVSGL